jgi:hypothetical protein
MTRIYVFTLLLLGLSYHAISQVDIDPVPVLPEPCIDSVDLEFFALPVGGQECSYWFFQDILPTYDTLGVFYLNIEWDFGDGNTYIETNNAAVYHTFDAPGTYTVCATIWSTNGEECCKTRYCKDVVVTGDCDPCIHLDNFDFRVTGTGPFVVEHWGSISNVNNFGYLIEFGDGRLFSASLPYTFNYFSDGSYAFSVTIFYFNPQTGACCSRKITKRVNYRAGRAPEVIDITNVDVQEQTISSDDVSLFPNPTGGEFTLKSLNGLLIQSATIYSVSGKIMHSENDVDDRSEIQMNLGHLPPGVYYVLLNETDAENRAFKQLVIE